MLNCGNWWELKQQKRRNVRTVNRYSVVDKKGRHRRHEGQNFLFFYNKRSKIKRKRDNRRAFYRIIENTDLSAVDTQTFTGEVKTHVSDPNRVFYAECPFCVWSMKSLTYGSESYSR